MFSKIIADYYGTPTPIQQLASLPVARAADRHGQPVRPRRDGRHREGDPRVRPRREPDQRRQADPHRLPRAHRGAPQGVHQGREARPRTAGSPIRNIRRKAKEALDKLEKDGEVGEDDVTRAEKRLDALTKKYVDPIDECSSTRKPSCSKSERRPPMTDDRTRPPRRPPPERPRRPRPAGGGRLGVVLLGPDGGRRCSLQDGLPGRRWWPLGWSRSGSSIGALHVRTSTCPSSR